MACTILVIYHSQTGNTRRMAQAVAQGVAEMEGCQARLLAAGRAGLEDLLSCQGLAIGSPENFGYMAGMVKDFFDRTYEQARGRKEIFKKPYVAFISAGNDGSGALSSIERILLGYQLKKVYDPVIARGGVTEEDLERCRELGQTIAAGCQAGIY
ncbi:flavodoxin [Desulfocarbo indianensis]|nr:flavodoxin [Desulfocarbo indianensis]